MRNVDFLAAAGAAVLFGVLIVLLNALGKYAESINPWHHSDGASSTNSDEDKEGKQDGEH